MLGDQYLWRKWRPYESPSRVPFLVRCQDVMKLNARPGVKRTELVELRNIFPTLANAANIKMPVQIYGKSILNLIKGESSWSKVLSLDHSQIYEKDNAWVALTDGRCKYIYFTLTGEEQHFDFQNDPCEFENLIQSEHHQSIRKRWNSEMVNLLKKRGSDWVMDNKLQIMSESVVMGPNIPESN